MLNKKGFTLIEIMVILIILLIIPAAIGWGMNIYKLTKCDFNKPYKAEIIRGICIPVAPAGAVVGYLTIRDSEKE